MWDRQLRSLEMYMPSTLAEVILSSSLSAMVTGGMSSGGCFLEKDMHKQLFSLVYVELHSVTHWPSICLISNGLQTRVPAGDVTSLPGYRVDHEFHAAASLQQVVNYEQEHYEPNTRSLWHTTVYREPATRMFLTSYPLPLFLQESSYPRHHKTWQPQVT